MDIDALMSLVESIPNGEYILAIFLAIYLLMSLFIVNKRIKDGNEGTFLWGLYTIKPHDKIKQLKDLCENQKKQFKEINEIAEQKNNILKLIHDVSEEITKLISIKDNHEFRHRKNKILELILHSINGVITNKKDNYHRVAIFVPKGNELKIYKAMGYSAEIEKELKLPINTSFAGNVLITGRPLYSGDVQNEKIYHRLSKTKKVYNSLACVPIKVKGKNIGVLSIDGTQKNSFREDDIDCLNYFAGLIAQIFELEKFHDVMVSLEYKRKYKRRVADDRREEREGTSIS
ncbi:putative methionine-R-sulfoxide reductase with GAF domain [Desulfohalotomaculum tongense]|uniref:GAF domain-containing protein n=1 Tax=Desulforadius tongensis TaxID=1216062 RepID=UPI00195E82E0|nr:GAF domain-containing protein [Desulforadius tongensis]MBM7856095.1 putative methionine-R-sulfoxide reductase with GAF domain [Desulforadius tongensis]